MRNKELEKLLDFSQLIASYKEAKGDFIEFIKDINRKDTADLDITVKELKNAINNSITNWPLLMALLSRAERTFLTDFNGDGTIGDPKDIFNTIIKILNLYDENDKIENLNPKTDDRKYNYKYLVNELENKYKTFFTKRPAARAPPGRQRTPAQRLRGRRVSIKEGPNPGSGEIRRDVTAGGGTLKRRKPKKKISRKKFIKLLETQ